MPFSDDEDAQIQAFAKLDVEQTVRKADIVWLSTNGMNWFHDRKADKEVYAGVKYDDYASDWKPRTHPDFRFRYWHTAYIIQNNDIVIMVCSNKKNNYNDRHEIRALHSSFRFSAWTFHFMHRYPVLLHTSLL